MNKMIHPSKAIYRRKNSLGTIGFQKDESPFPSWQRSVAAGSMVTARTESSHFKLCVGSKLEMMDGV